MKFSVIIVLLVAGQGAFGFKLWNSTFNNIASSSDLVPTSGKNTVQELVYGGLDDDEDDYDDLNFYDDDEDDCEADLDYYEDDEDDNDTDPGFYDDDDSDADLDFYKDDEDDYDYYADLFPTYIISPKWIYLLILFVLLYNFVQLIFNVIED